MESFVMEYLWARCSLAGAEVAEAHAEMRVLFDRR